MPNGAVVGEKVFKTDGSRGDYDAAKDTCLRMGGTLASPKNAAENDALRHIVEWHRSTAILGIDDLKREGRFEHLDGKGLEYSNWAPGEPNNAGNEHCVEMHPDGRWHDRSCDIGLLIICVF